MNVIPFVKFVAERERVRYRKESALMFPPYTRDTILQTYRFCNVRREDDRETRWIAENWREAYKDSTEVWFAMVLARLVNWSPSLKLLGAPLPWKPARFLSVSRDVMDSGGKFFSGAYIVSTNGHQMPKPEYLVQHVLNPLWKERKKLAMSVYNWNYHWGGKLGAFHKQLSSFNGMGSFMAAQVVADIKYTPIVKRLATDWETFAASGPGSRRGLNRVLGREVNAPWKESEWRRDLAKLQNETEAPLRKERLDHPPEHAQDLQNCLCEFDKYERTRLGEGRPRSRYTPTSGQHGLEV